jgi:tRNA G10  N-methylase Trm11
MEPEIGFLMANLALAGIVVRGRRRARVLDPCCGGGRLLLYAAASGATGPLVGVDSDPDVWDSAEWEERHRGGGVVVGKLSPLPAVVLTFVVGDVWNPSSTAALCTPNSFDAIICNPPYNIGAPVLVDGQDSRPRNYHDKGHGFRRNESGESWGGASSPDIIPSILSIAANVLVMGGRIVFFLPVRGGDMTKSLEELLLSRGFPQDGGCDKSCPLRLLRHSSRRQNFSPTFSRWLVCMEKL